MPASASKKSSAPFVALVAVVALCFAALAACAGQDDDAGGAAPRKPTATKTPNRSPSATPSPTPTRTAATSPLTGLSGKWRRPVLAVKIDNVGQARPQTGLASADLIYVEQVEAGLARLMAVFSSRLPSTVGPVRSARESDLEVLRQFGQPAFAYSGANSRLLPVIARAPLHDVSPAHAGSPYFRGDSRPAPHNLYASPKGLLADAPKASTARDIGFRFGDAPEGGRKVSSETVRYPAFRVGFRWSASERRWLVSMDGDPVRMTGGAPPKPATVVVQNVARKPSKLGDKWGNITPNFASVGKGKALVLRDGRAYDARWSRPRATGGTTFTTPAGKPMTFAPGQVWVVFKLPS
ncbi:DUF3048 domain-containing protein [Actinopolymorpha sp. B9G3]|uniref:DUF3048 domain-containing protein n=1 Tax=Actinopolymorpha sp. B9G3 TaxID=3158970 RepID=UPI0032D92557